MIYQSMTSPQLAAVDRNKTVVLVPIAAVEQHGPHMPTGTDALICTAIAERVEQRAPEEVLLLPTVWLGASAHHLRFGATLSADLDHLIAVLCDIGRSLLDDRFRRMLFVNGHGGNIDPLRVALRKLQPQYADALLVGGTYWSVADDLIARTLEGEHKFVGHACEFETSMILHLFPHLVNRDEMKDAGPLIADQIDGLFISRDMHQRTRAGCTGRPDLASAEKGELLFECIVERLANVVHQLADQPLARSYTDFLA
jgi:creatinine amidohydrolase